ncbi:alpha/beta-hydrolase [Hyaloscypha variabilis]
MASLLLLILAGTLGKVGAGTIPQTYTPTNANCIDYDIPVSVSTKGINWIAPKWTNNTGLIDFVSLTSSRSPANFSSPVGGSVDLNGEYTISATFCSPKTTAEKSGNILLATHGIGYDRRYWNSAFQPENYNFAQYATSQGYSIFFYDRLGTGKSSTLSGFVNQGTMQVDILDQIARQIRAGNYTGTIGVPKKIVFVSHSYGSAISTATIAGAPDIADAAVLTGLAFAQNFQTVTEAMAPRIASVQDKRWSYLDAGYLTWTDIYANINCFFKEPTYNWDAAQYADSIKAPLAVAELLSIASFKNGEYDFLVCNGYCPGVNEEPAKSLFAGSKAFNATILPKTDHGLHFRNNALEGYKAITDYLSEQGV